MKIIKIIIVILSLVFIVGIQGCGYKIITNYENLTTEGVLEELVDGDTVKVRNQKTNELITVRVLGVDFIDIKGEKADGTPRINKWLDYGISEERVRYCYNRGNTELRNKWENITVILEYDDNEDIRDKYNRTLAYVKDSANPEKYLEQDVLLGGYGVVYDVGTLNCRYCLRYKEITQRMVDNKTGCLWSYSLGDEDPYRELY